MNGILSRRVMRRTINDSEFYQRENSRGAKIKEPFWLKNLRSRPTTAVHFLGSAGAKAIAVCAIRIALNTIH